jgi:ABC-type Mn2+/Zn2+ transport system permease subunit
MGVVFTGLFAFGLVVFTKIKTDLHLNHILFGNILGIEPHDKWEAFMVGGMSMAVVLVLRRDLLLFCFDPGHAQTIGLRTRTLYYVLLSLLAATVVAALKAVGVLLVIAMLITPGCIGFLLSERFGWVQGIACASAIFSTLAGVYISFFSNASPAACIVLVQTLLFVIALVFAPKRGLLAQRSLSAMRKSRAPLQPVD